MKMKNIVIAALMLFTVSAFAQENRELVHNKETNMIDVTIYHDNGKISQTGSYTLDGKPHGDWFSYCEQGNKLVSAKYDNGAKVGKWFYWSGSTLKEVDYKNNAIASINEWTNKYDVASRN